MTETALGPEKCFFSFRQGLQTQWVEINDTLLNYVATKIIQSEEASLLARRLFVAEFD